MESETIFVYVSSIIFVVVAFIIPKKMKAYEIYVTTIFAVLFGLLVDIVLAVKYKLYVLDKPGVQIPTLVGQVILYATASIMTLNLYPYQKSKTTKIIYILLVTVVTLAYEYLAFIYGFIKYNEWKIWYSALCYPFLIYFLVLHYRFFQRIVRYKQ